MTSRVDEERSTRCRPRQLRALLCPREGDIAMAIAVGMNDRQIAQMFGITRSTLHSHKLHLFNKLGLYNRTELAVFVLRMYGDIKVGAA